MESMPFRVNISRWITEGWNLLLIDIGNFALIGIVSLLFLHIPFVWGPVWTAMIYAALRLMDKGRISIEDYFEGYRFFIPAILASLLIMLLTLVGLIFLIVPGLVVFSMYLFTFPYIAQEGNDFGAAMRASRQAASRDYFGFTLFMMALVALNILGALFFYVGLVFTLPLSAASVAVAFREFRGLPAAATTPAPSKPIVIP